MKRQNLFCDSCDFIFDQKWHNLSLSDLVLADCTCSFFVIWMEAYDFGTVLFIFRSYALFWHPIFQFPNPLPERDIIPFNLICHFLTDRMKIPFDMVFFYLFLRTQKFGIKNLWNWLKFNIYPFAVAHPILVTGWISSNGLGDSTADRRRRLKYPLRFKKSVGIMSG